METWCRRLAETLERDLRHGATTAGPHRDDLRLRGVRALEPTEEPPGGVEGKLVVLVDDVLYSGRTVRAALDALRDRLDVRREA